MTGLSKTLMVIDFGTVPALAALGVTSVAGRVDDSAGMELAGAFPLARSMASAWGPAPAESGIVTFLLNSKL